MEYGITTRPFTTQCQMIWPRPGEDHIDNERSYDTSRRSFFVIHPEWLSEDVSPPPPRGRPRRPWPFEYSGARSTYATPVERLRNRILNDSAIAEETKRQSEHEAYQTRHISPWQVNNPDENPFSNSLSKRPATQPHTLPWNNARRCLNLELRQPPMEQRFRDGDLSEYLYRDSLPEYRYSSPTSRAATPAAMEAANMRLLSGEYRTTLEWH